MKISKYEEISEMAMDAMREISSIGSGNAATALSSVLDKRVKMTLPEVKVLGFNEAVRKLGGPETIVAATLVQMSGEINGIMLFLQRIDFINIVLESVSLMPIKDYSELNEFDVSALNEVGNIIISTYVNAVTKFTDISVTLSVPAIAINMLGGLLSVPMAELGEQTDKIMVLDGKFHCDDKEVYCGLLMLPDVESLNYLMKKLGVE